MEPELIASRLANHITAFSCLVSIQKCGTNCHSGDVYQIEGEPCS